MINPRFFQAFQEDRVIESNTSYAVFMSESIIARMDIMMTLSVLSCIGRHHAGRETTFVRVLEHGESLLVVGTLVELEEAGPVLIRGADLFEAVAAR